MELFGKLDKSVEELRTSISLEERFVPKKLKTLITSSQPKLIFTGASRSGKTTLINALLGEEVFPRNLMSTRRIVHLVYSEDRYISVKSISSGVTEERIRFEIPRRGIFPANAEKEIFYSSDDLTQDLSHYVTIGWPNPKLKQISLVDTPGFVYS